MSLPFKGSKHGITRLRAAVDSIKMLIEQKLLYCKGTEIGIVLFGSDITNNQINDKQGGYENVNTIMYMNEPSTDLLKSLESKITSSKSKNLKFFKNHKPHNLDIKGDWIDGLIVGFDMIYNKVGDKKYTKRIFLITDGESEVKEPDQLDSIVDQLIKTDTSVNIISIDF